MILAALEEDGKPSAMNVDLAVAEGMPQANQLISFFMLIGCLHSGVRVH